METNYNPNVQDQLFATSSAAINSKSTKKISPKQKLSVEDNLNKTEDSKILQSRSIAVKRNESLRQDLGGKGLFLTTMSNALLPVPEFTVINTQILMSIEQLTIDTISLQAYIANICIINTAKTSIAEIKDYLTNNLCDNPKQGWLDGLSAYIASDDFYSIVKNSPYAIDINNIYTSLNNSTEDPIIVRSSGIEEDCFGNAQAGKYLSKVTSEQKLLKTCLEVIASAYKTKVCNETPKPMALVIQKCINSTCGGVIMSYSSREDNSIRIEYAPGQPKGAVSGLAEIQPHVCQINRSKNNQDISYTYTSGHTPYKFSLEDKTSANLGFVEIKQADTSGFIAEDLNKKYISLIHEYITTLENIFFCPVDVEFAINKQGKLYLLQVRPMTTLSGGASFNTDVPSDSIATGLLVSEGVAYGKAVFINSNTQIEVAHGSIIIANDAFDWMLQHEVLQNTKGFIFARGGTCNHVAISLQQAGVPCFIAADTFENIKPITNLNVTMVCGNFKGTATACLLLGDKTLQFVSTSTTKQLTDLNINVVPSALPANSNIDDCIQWLNKQNAKLLNYFNSNSILDLLTAKNVVMLSMSKDRVTLTNDIITSINIFLQDLENFILSYEYFLNFSKINNNIPTSFQYINCLLFEYKQDISAIKDKFIRLQTIISSELTTIKFTQTEDKLKLTDIVFSAWQETCYNINTTLKQLKLPKSSGEIVTTHDIIFYIHQQIFKAIVPVVITSDYKNNVKEQDGITWINLQKIKSIDNTLEQNINDAKDIIDARDIKIIQMTNIDIITLDYGGNHVCTLELIKKAEHNKNITLKFTLSDNFCNFIHQGKFKRAWFLTEILKQNHITKKNINDLHIIMNPRVGLITLEFNNIATDKQLNLLAVDILSILTIAEKLDIPIDNVCLHRNIQNWNFNILEKILDDNTSKETAEMLNIFLFTIVFRHKNNIFAPYNKLLTNEQLAIIKDAMYLAKKFNSFENTKKTAITWFDITTEFSNRTIEEQQQILSYLLLADRELNFNLIVNNINDINNIKFFANLLHGKGKIIKVLPKDYKCNIELATIAVSNNPKALEYLSKELQNNINIVSIAIKQDVNAIKYAGVEIKNNKEFITPLITQVNSVTIDKYIGSMLLDDEAFCKLLINDMDFNFQYFSRRLRFNIAFVNHCIITAKIPVRCVLPHTSKEIRNNITFMTKFINIDPSSLKMAEKDVIDDFNAVSLAVAKSGKILQYASNRLKKHRSIVKLATKQDGMSIKYADKSYTEDYEIATLACSSNGLALEFISDNLKNNVEQELTSKTGIVTIAIANNSEAMKYAGKAFHDSENFIFTLAKTQESMSFIFYTKNQALRANKELADIILQKDIYCIRFFADEIRNDFNHAINLVRNNTYAFDSLGEEIQKNKIIFKTAFEKKGIDFLSFLNNCECCELLDNEELMREVIAINASAIKYASTRIQNNYKDMYFK